MAQYSSINGKVPDELWQQAYDLLDDHDQWSVCKALGISSSQMKRLKARFVNYDNEPDEVTFMPVQNEDIDNHEGIIELQPITIKTSTGHCLTIPLEDKAFALTLVHLCFRAQ